MSATVTEDDEISMAPTGDESPGDGLEIVASSSVDADDLEAYVLECERATFFHLPGWTRAVSEEFGHKDRGYVALRGGEIVGLLPINECKGLRGGKNWISCAYAVYGGPAGDDRDVEHALVERAKRDATTSRVGRLELRCRDDVGLDLPKADLHATFIKDLPETVDAVLPGVPKKARADARKARKSHGLTLHEGRWYVADLVRLFHLNKRSLGSPALPKSFFARLLSTFGDRCTVHVVKRSGESLAAVMSFLFRDRVLAYYSGTGEGVDRAYKASVFMYMAMQEWSVANGYRVFDFGRSRKDSGAFKFKEHQGFEAADLHYGFHLVRDGGLPTFNPSNPKTKVLQRTWQRLPLAVTTRLSGPAARYLP